MFKQKTNQKLKTESIVKAVTDQKPLVSIITVVFNGKNTLEKTILSVINQNYQNIEYIIIDGGSTDGTLEIIHKYEKEIDYWISEKDNGIYDAMNKGILAANGKFVNFMNAGDYFFDNNILQKLPLNPLSKIIFGNIMYESGKVFESTFDYRMYLKNTLHHQSAFYALDLLKQLGLFDTNFKILADYDMNFKALKLGIKFEQVPLLVAICSDYGISDIPKFTNYNEEVKIRLKSNYLLGVLLASYSYIRFIVKKNCIMTQINASIVLYHNKKEQLIKVINSFLDTDLQVRLYLIDNSSNDDLKGLCEIDRVYLQQCQFRIWSWT